MNIGASTGDSLYASAEKIQPRIAWGRYARLRLLAMLLLLGVYYLLPWVQWQGEPLVLLDLAARRFHVFGMTLVPQDLLYMTGLMLLMAVSLFFFTTLAGRLFCGYACPQTVWTQAFMWLEFAFEGDGPRRQRLDRQPWGAKKLARRGGRHVAWILFAGLTGLTFVAYFVPARELFPAAWHFELQGWPLFWAVFYGFATWGNAGFMREQVCKYMCPYARFQSVMFDRDTLIIDYAALRGEPRKSLAKKAGHPAGDCIDCRICVQVCPTGIDIRQGLQYECIARAACVDACNTVMDTVGRPRGLIRYTSARHEQEGRFRILRPRLVGYAAVWLVVATALVTALLTRSELTVDLIRDRTHLYRVLPDNRVENVYQLRLTNAAETPLSLALSVRDASGSTPYTVLPDRITVGAGSTQAFSLSVRSLAGAPALRQIELQLRAADGRQWQRKGTFFSEVHP